MRIGILTHNYPATSKERKDASIFIYDFAHELAKHADVFVLCPDFKGKKEQYKKVPVTWFDWGGGSEKFGNWSLYSPASVIKFIKLLFSGCVQAPKFVRENNLDFCLAAWSLPSGVFAWWTKKQIRTRYAVWSLGSDINVYSKVPILRQLIVSTLKEASVCFANSFLLAKKVKGLTRRDCKFMPAVTDFSVKSFKHTTKRDTNFKFLFVGRLEKVKGPDVLIGACKKLAASGQAFELTVLGDGSMMKELKEASKSIRKTAEINFLGAVGKEVLAKNMLQADCLVVASRNESLPLVILEAAHAKLPVLATKVGDCPRVIKTYNIGQLVDKESSSKLAKGMQKMIKDKGILKKRYGQGLKRLTKDFTQERAVEVLLDAIHL